LIVEPSAQKAKLATLESALVAALAEYFVPPIVSSQAEPAAERKLAEELLNRRNHGWPSGWPRSYRNVLGGADTPIDVENRWTGFERTIGKEAWLATKPPRPPWPLVAASTPPIVTFHSFKGGVGRTTLVAAYALWLANQTPRRRVAIVDLDLEAPGVGTLFGVESERGVLDVLVDHIATGRIDLADASLPSQLAGELSPSITVFPAGKLTASYVQKLARLDFSSTEPGQANPVGAALTAMLRSMKRDHDVILLDARAGLHDLAGMSLHGLAHVDVLVFRSTTQNLAGLDQTLRTLGSREDDPELVLVETLLPVRDDEFEARRQRTRARVYELLCEHVYPDSDPPQLGDVGVAHDVVSVRRKELLDGLDSLDGRIDDVLKDTELQAVARRIDDASVRDDENDT
jgi:MinD-like ATPase involved in chromosome partitioning or flagellar assembly